MAEGVISLLLEKIMDFGKEKIWEKAVSLPREEIAKVLSAKAEIERLEEELNSTMPIIRDAHNKQFTSKEVKDWLLRLNDVAYDAHDVIDRYRVECCTAIPDHPQESKVRRTLASFSMSRARLFLLHEIGGKMSDINERLCALYTEKDRYGLVPVPDKPGLTDGVGGIREELETTSAITEPKMIGRENDEQLVIKWLIEESPETEESVSVLAVVGMAGVGKTTLAKAVFNNDAVQQCFDRSMWVCVSCKPKPLDVLRKILEEVDEKGNRSAQSIGLNALRSQINNDLRNRSFLLVLDDVWDSGWWGELRGIWQGCRSGSKVLITSRQISVANSMGLAHLHEMRGLSEEKSWLLFLNKALKRGEGEQHLGGVRDVGKDIVSKCRGLPLALATVGSLLGQKQRRKSIWQDVLNSPFWDLEGPHNHKVFAAIALSYMSISFSLKQCLISCSIFPKGSVIRKETLIRLWVAEGLVLKEHGVDMASLAEAYLEALVGCSLIQADVFMTKIRGYTLHDIVHDFVLYVRGEEHVSVDMLKTGMVSRHGRFFSAVGGVCSFGALAHQNLRILLWQKIDYFSADNYFTFRWLRVLDMSKGNFLELPESIGDLVLLRYINLSHTQILELPESITALHDLQTLDLSYSQLRKLPTKLSSLGALRHLDIQRTDVLEYVPKEIGKLARLQTLGKFVVGCATMDGKGSNLEELHDLNNLRGNLTIEHLERVNSRRDAKLAQLTRKENLQSLVLCCGRKHIMEFDRPFSEKMENVYEELQPPMDISCLGIKCYAGIRFPSWLSSTIYYRLEEITIYDCHFLENLPSLGHLPNLVRLIISFAERVKVFDTTFDYFDEQVMFPKLEQLNLMFMYSMEEWLFNAGVEIMPQLRWLTVIECPKLKVVPFFPFVEEIRFFRLSSWEGWPNAREKMMPSLKMMYVNCSNLKCLPHCPILEELCIIDCHEVIELPHSLALSKLSVQHCSQACFSWDDTYELQNLTDLEIIGSPKLAPLLERLSDMKELRSLVLCHMPDLTMVLAENLCNLGKLESLKIEDSQNLTSLPEEGLHLRRLKRLALRDLPQLEPLPPTLLDNMRVLEELDLGPRLECLQLQEHLRRLKLTRMRRLRVSGFRDLGMSCFGDLMEDLDGVEELVIEDCPELLSIADVLKQHSFPVLRILKVSSLTNFELVPWRWGKLLTCVLVIDSMDMSEKLSGLVDLRCKIDALTIKVLPDLDSLPEWIQYLDQLEVLEVERSDKLTLLPDWLGKLPKLRRMLLHRLPELRSLPDSMASLCQLEELVIDWCPKLSSIPDWVQCLPRLRDLHVHGCELLLEWHKKHDWYRIVHIPDPWYWKKRGLTGPK